MTFADWVRFKKLRRNKVAEMLGISPGHMSDLCQHRFWPNRELARRIYDLTEGDVTPTDFLFDIESIPDTDDVG
jgi:hypothetical protein